MLYKYSRIIEPAQGVKYGTFKGYFPSSSVVFIKLPQGEGLYGWEGGFCKFASALNRRTGFHVICSENHGDEISKKYDLAVLQEFIKASPYGCTDVRFVGVGDGATYGLSWLCRQMNFSKKLLINMPMSHEIGNTVELLNGVDRNNMRFVYGDKTPFYRYTPLLKRMYTDVVVIEGVNQTFSGRPKQFVGLEWMV